MINYYERLKEDFRFEEALNSCMNCGVCTAICPAAETYLYDPRIICNKLQTRNNDVIEELLKSETIWYCGQCMSCKTRCPRGNTPGMLIQVLRSLSQDLGLFTESEKGRQQLYIKRTIGQWILERGYCINVDEFTTERHPEQGPVWDWIQENKEAIYDKLGANYNKSGVGILRKIPKDTLDELKKIFDVTGGTEHYHTIEHFSMLKAQEMGIGFDQSLNNDYIRLISEETTKNHYHE